MYFFYRYSEVTLLGNQVFGLSIGFPWDIESETARYFLFNTVSSMKLAFMDCAHFVLYYAIEFVLQMSFLDTLVNFHVTYSFL